MTSNNIQKIVQNKLHLNPWVLSKNTNEIVNNCIQKIYKQIPQNFTNELHKPKVASQKPENKAPLRILKTQECEQRQPVKIRPQIPVYPAKKTSRSKLNHNHLLDILNMSNNHNNQISRKMTSTATSGERNKKLMKSPNFKIYNTKRSGFSASSSRSSLFRRFDERRRARQQQLPTQVNHLVRSIHNGDFDSTFAKYLMPVRNQKLKGNLGSLPEAMKVSSSIQHDLMCIDAAIRNRISVGDRKKVSKSQNIEENDGDGLRKWKHPPPITKFNSKTTSVENEILPQQKKSKSKIKKTQKMSLEHRDYGRYNVGPLLPVKRSVPPNELFTAQHDREKTELHEKHRRDRMKKLGLARDSPRPTSQERDPDQNKFKGDEEGSKLKKQYQSDNTVKAAVKNDEKDEGDECCYSKLSPLGEHMEARRKVMDMPYVRHSQSHFPVVKNKAEVEETVTASESLLDVRRSKTSNHQKPTISPKTSEIRAGGEPSTSTTSTTEESTSRHGPLAMATAQVTASLSPTNGYRNNRSSLYPFTKY